MAYAAVFSGSAQVAPRRTVLHGETQDCLKSVSSIRADSHFDFLATARLSARSRAFSECPPLLEWMAAHFIRQPGNKNAWNRYLSSSLYMWCSASQNLFRV